MTVFAATPATAQRYGLAEGPVWDPLRQQVLWVDIDAGAVHIGRFAATGIEPVREVVVDRTVGAAVIAEDGTLLVAGAKRLHTVGPDGVITPRVEVVAPDADSRLNDGGCDPAGRFLVGSMALDDRHGAEVLVRADGPDRLTVLDDDLTLSNGLAFSPDHHWLYSTDTTPGTVWRRRYDVTTGDVAAREHLLHVEDGSPDGLCVDADGNLWIAIWGGGAVRCFAPDGTHMHTVEVPAPNTTSVAFAGPRLRTLVITTESQSLSAGELARHPDSGRLFLADVGVAGAPMPYWAGWR